MNKFFRIAFANSGDRTAVPDAVDPSGNVSYTEGYGSDYQLPKTDPDSKNIERDKMNDLFYEVTLALQELQGQGVPDFITSVLNGGTAYSYSANALVRYSGALYLSLANSNTATPTDATKWALLPTAALIQAGTFVSAVAAGTADALTAAFTPAFAALGAQQVAVRAASANATTTPTFNPDGLGPETMVKGNNLPLAPGDIPGAGAWLLLKRDSTLGKWVLLNPALGVTNTGATFGSVVTTNGLSSYDVITSIPADAQSVQVRMYNVGISQNNNFRMQVSVGGVFLTSGYTTVYAASNSAASSDTAGLVFPTASTSDVYDGTISINLVGFAGGSYRYELSGTFRRLAAGTPVLELFAGSVSTSAPIDGVRLITVLGSDTFNNGYARGAYSRGT